MSYAGLSWRQLFYELEKEVASRAARAEGAGGYDHYSEVVVALLWEEAAARLGAKARLVLRRWARVEIEDIVQAAVLKLQTVEQLRAIANCSSPDEFVARMLRVEAANAARRRQRDRTLVHGLAANVHPDVDTEVSAKEIADSCLQAGMSRLTAEERHLLHQRFWERRSIKALAEDGQVSYAAMAQRLCRLRSKLRELMTTEGM
jgi:RNA polymerase sigma factor (sigma-70 family)